MSGSSADARPTVCARVAVSPARGMAPPTTGKGRFAVGRGSCGPGRCPWRVVALDAEWACVQPFAGGLEASASASEADDSGREFDQELSASHEWFGLVGCEEGGAVLDVALGADQLAQGFSAAGGSARLPRAVLSSFAEVARSLALRVAPVRAVTIASLAPIPAWMASPAAAVGRSATRLSSAEARYSSAFRRKALAWLSCSALATRRRRAWCAASSRSVAARHAGCR